MEWLLEYIKYYVNLTSELEQDVRKTFRIKQYPQGHRLISEGETCRNLYFLSRGTIRSFVIQKEKDITTWIYPEGYFVTAWGSFLKEEPSLEYMEFTQDAEVVFITKQSFELLFEKHPTLEKFWRYLLEEQVAELNDQFKDFMFTTAQEKYDALIKMFPDITQRINLGHIASFLGVTQETLSRIRGKRS